MRIKNIIFWLHLIKISIKASLIHKKKAFFEITLMLFSRFFLLAVWLIFFNHFNDINGWKLNEIATLLAIIAGAYGCLQAFFGGIYQLPSMVVNGELDVFLLYPRNVLWHVILSKSLLRGWGDIIYVVLLIFIAKIFALKALLLLCVGIFCSLAVLLAANIFIISFAFYFKGGENFVHKYHMILLIFCSYPTNIYFGFLKIILFTIIPVGIMGYLPVDLIKNFTWLKLFSLLGISIASICVSSYIFSKALKKYISNNLINLRI